MVRGLEENGEETEGETVMAYKDWNEWEGDHSNWKSRDDWERDEDYKNSGGLLGVLVEYALFYFRERDQYGLTLWDRKKYQIHKKREEKQRKRGNKK